MSFERTPAYKRFVRKGARMMARILNNTDKQTTATVHVLAEPGAIAGDLLVKIAEIAAQNPDKDIIVYVQRFNPEDLGG